MNDKETRSVSAIENGTVIDHVPPEEAIEIIKMLDIHEERITIGKNFRSQRMGKKGIIKISNKELTKEEINRIALKAPNATISKIRNYEVVEKFEVEIPNRIESLECLNPNCITRVQTTKTIFVTISKEPLKLKCHYCERTFDI